MNKLNKHSTHTDTGTGTQRARNRGDGVEPNQAPSSPVIMIKVKWLCAKSGGDDLFTVILFMEKQKFKNQANSKLRRRQQL